MSFTSRLALSFLVLFCTQNMFALGQANNPWSNTQMAEAFISCFMDSASQSGTFTKNQMDDMSTISDTVMIAIEKMAKGRKSSKSKLQALNMAFASSVAEIVVIDEGGQSIEAKTGAIADALIAAFLQTTGAVNFQFVNEIKGLIFRFAQNNANQVSDEGSARGRGGTAASLASTLGAGKYNPSALDYDSAHSYGSSGSYYPVSISSSSSESYGLNSQGFSRPEPQGLSAPTSQGFSGSEQGLSYASRQQDSPGSSSVSFFSTSSASNGGFGQNAQGPSEPTGSTYQGPTDHGSPTLVSDVASIAREQDASDKGSNISGEGGQDRLGREKSEPAATSADGTEQAGLSVESGQKGTGQGSFGSGQEGQKELDPSEFGVAVSTASGVSRQGDQGEGYDSRQEIQGGYGQSVYSFQQVGLGVVSPATGGTGQGGLSGGFGLGEAGYGGEGHTGLGQGTASATADGAGQGSGQAVSAKYGFGSGQGLVSADAAGTAIEGVVQGGQSGLGGEAAATAGGVGQEQVGLGGAAASAGGAGGQSSIGAAAAGSAGQSDLGGRYGSGQEGVVGSSRGSYGSGQGEQLGLGEAAAETVVDGAGGQSSQGGAAAETVADGAGGQSSQGGAAAETVVDGTGGQSSQGGAAAATAGGAGQVGLGGAVAVASGTGQGGQVSHDGAAAVTSAGGAAGQSGQGGAAVAAAGVAGQGEQVDIGEAAVAVASGTGQGGQEGYGSRQGGQEVFGQSVFGSGQEQVGLSGGAATAVGGAGQTVVYSENGSGQGVNCVSTTAFVNAAMLSSRLSSPAVSARVSSIASNLASRGASSPGVLSSVISNAVTQISSNIPALSWCDVFIQALLELVSALVHILSSADQSTQLVSQSVSQIMM